MIGFRGERLRSRVVTAMTRADVSDCSSRYCFSSALLAFSSYVDGKVERRSTEVHDEKKRDRREREWVT